MCMYVYCSNKIGLNMNHFHSDMPSRARKAGVKTKRHKIIDVARTQTISPGSPASPFGPSGPGQP